MTSLKVISGNAQVFDSYGKKCNSKFLLHYGFTIESNREADGICQNELQLSFNLSADDPLFSLRRTFINASQQFSVTMNASDDGTSQCLNYLRVKYATSDDLRRAGTRFKRRGPISLQSEVASFEALADAAQAQLEMYPTTIEDDDRMLCEGHLDPFSNRRHAVIIIRGEKEMCHFFIDLARVMKSLLLPLNLDKSEDIGKDGVDLMGANVDQRAVRTAKVAANFAGNSDIDRFVRDIHRHLLSLGL
jgi:histone-lysine N-methyltransferase SETD3